MKETSQMAGEQMVSHNGLPREWRERTANILSGYRFLAFGIAAVQISLFPLFNQSVIPPEPIVAAMGIYTLIRVLQPVRWHQVGIVGFSLLGVDITICVFLVLITGGIYSPYLLYTLVPVLTAGLFMDTRVTILVVGISLVYVIGGTANNPFFDIQLSMADSGYLLVYVVAACISGVLPYLTNVNLMQRLKNEYMLLEQQRLSREVHDGTLQTILTLSWQVQLLNRQLADTGIDLNEPDQLAELLEKTGLNPPNSLETINRPDSNGNFITSLSASETLFENTIEAMATTVELRDPYTAGHQRRVTQLATAIAMELGLPEGQIKGLRLATLVHDIGKTRIPAEILTNPTRLTAAEFTIIQTHPEAGYDILKTIEFSYPIAMIVYQHHERLDGSGYPNGMKGDEIMLEARILAVADVVEAMSSHRPYRPAIGLDNALAEISENKGKLYDPQVVDACVKLFKGNSFKFE